MIHCIDNQAAKSDIEVSITFPSGESTNAKINIRPHAKQILVNLSKYFEIIIFTASHSCYANPIIDYLDEQNVVVKRMFRNNCSQLSNGVYTKDLNVIKGREKKDLIIVDNAVYSFLIDIDNGIPILPFYND